MKCSCDFKFRQLINLIMATAFFSCTNPLGSSSQSAGIQGVTTTTTMPSPPAPTITAVSPGLAIAGATITVTGTGFQTGINVTLGGAGCQTLTFINSTHLTCVTPVTQSVYGPTPVTVINPSALPVTSNGLFTNIGQPMLWLHADTLGLADGATVTSWTDSSGNGNTASQGAGNAPTFALNAINGQPAVSFSGANKYLSLPSNSANFSQGFSTFLVNQVVLPAGSQPWARFYEFGNGCNSASFYLTRAYNSSNFQVSLNSSDYWSWTAGILQSTNQLFSIIMTPVSGTTGTILSYSNNTRLGTSGNSNGGAAINLPANVTRTSNYLGLGTCGDPSFGGLIPELLIYNSALTDSQRTGIQNYLNLKYALY